MLADNVLGWEIVLKISYLPSKFRFSAKYSFFGQSLSRGHYQSTYQPPEGVYLLNNYNLFFHASLLASKQVMRVNKLFKMKQPMCIWTNIQIKNSSQFQYGYIWDPRIVFKKQYRLKKKSFHLKMIPKIIMVAEPVLKQNNSLIWEHIIEQPVSEASWRARRTHFLPLLTAIVIPIRMISITAGVGRTGGSLAYL